MELLEIVKISETYTLSPELSFNMHYTYTDSAKPDAILEEMDGKYKIHKGKSWSMIDNVEFFQGDQFSVAVYYNDSIIMLNRREEYSDIMQIPMMDSLFRKAHVADMQVTSINDSTRSIRIRFNQQSAYRGYEMQYDLNNFLIRKVKYYIPVTGDPENSISSGVECITISFSNYSDQVVSEDYFNEGRFFFSRGDRFFTQPAFAGFQLIASGNNQVQ